MRARSNRNSDLVAVQWMRCMVVDAVISVGRKPLAIVGLRVYEKLACIAGIPVLVGFSG